MKKMYKYIVANLLLLAGLVAFAPKSEAITFREILFPVIGHSGYSNSYYEPRAGGRVHEAIDIFAAKMTPVIAVVDGTISFAPFPEPSYGWMLTIRDDDGYRYNYIHLNNDTPGTDNGRGGAMNAYTFDMVPGSRVVAGQHIGWVGDSGNAEDTPPHLHFEMITPQNRKANAFYSLNAAQRLTRPVLHVEQEHEILPFGKTINGVHVSVDVGNFDNDADAEIVTASAHRFSGPKVRVYNDDGSDTGIRINNPFPGFFGELDVAAADIDGDGIDEIIVAPGKGGPPLVKIFRRNGTLVGQFHAYFEGYRWGVRVSAGDIDGDGIDEIIVGTMAGLAPVVRVFKPDGTMIHSFYAFDQNFRGGIDVAAGDIDGDGIDEIIVGSGPGMAGQVRIFSGRTLVRQFVAYSSTMTSGLRVSAGNVRQDTPEAEIVVAISEGSPSIRMFNGNGAILGSRFFFEQWWRGTNDIGAGPGDAFAASGVNRRATIRQAFN